MGVHQCHECFGIFRRPEGQPASVFLDSICPECQFRRSLEASDGEVEDIPLEVIEVKVTWLDRLKAWASRWAAYMDALLLRLL